MPGGTFLRGLSEREEERVRELASAAGMATGEVKPLLDELATMRPVAEVAVRPFLMGQGPGDEIEPGAIADWLADGPFRLPTEAE